MGLLDDLVAEARARARTLSREEPSRAATVPSFAEALQGKKRLKVIAEYKRSSPSRGALGPDVDLEKQVQIYETAGAAAVSVLTEPRYFGGSLEDLERAASALKVPALMKDFIVDPAQVRAARRAGASAVLLIVRCLSKAQLDELASAALDYGLAPLVECHRAKELDQALLIRDAVIGINNRNLETLEIDLSLSPRLLAEIPEERVTVAESGYERAQDVSPLRGMANAVLVGSALMTAKDPQALIEELAG